MAKKECHCPIRPGGVSSIILDSSPTAKRTFNVKDVPNPHDAFSQAVRIDNTVYVSGCLAVNPATNKLIRCDTDEEAQMAMKNLGEVLKAAGTSYKNVVKANIYVTDMDDMDIIEKVYRQYFPRDYPALTYVEVPRLPLDAKFQIEAIAAVPHKNVHVLHVKEKDRNVGTHSKAQSELRPLLGESVTSKSKNLGSDIIYGNFI